MTRMVVRVLWMALFVSAACGGSGTQSSNGANTDSEVATSVVSGALNNSGGSVVAWSGLPRQPASLLERVIDAINPIGVARAASWDCTGGTLLPSFDGPGSYTYTPVSCSVTWRNGKTASSAWSGSFMLAYGTSCDAQHAWIGNQAAGCSVTRTTAMGGTTRTITGPLGNSYAITHDTNGAGTGWDSSVSPAPNSGGVVATCGTGGCAAGGTLLINGSHLTGTVTPSGGTSTKIWDHTVTTTTLTGLTLTVSGLSRTLNGSVTVEHNLAKYTANATFSAVTFAAPGCCFPTGGTVTTTFDGGANKGMTESLAFSSVCGEATLTATDGSTMPLTLVHCL